MKIITNNIDKETAEDILSDVLQSIVPIIIARYLPNENYEQTNGKLFDSCLEILKSGKFT
jgi:hypothetical protein